MVYYVSTIRGTSTSWTGGHMPWAIGGFIYARQDHNFPSMSSGIMAFCHAMNRVISLVDVCPNYANELLEVCNSFCAYGLIFHISCWRLKEKLPVVTSSWRIWTNSLVITYFTIVNIYKHSKNTVKEMSSFWLHFHHWLHWKLSKWHLPVEPVTKMSSKCHFNFSESFWHRMLHCRMCPSRYRLSSRVAAEPMQ